MSRISLLAVLAAACTTSELHTYELDADVVVPVNITATLEAPFLVEVEWMGETHGVALLCDDVEGDLVASWSGQVETLGEVNHQAFTARVVPWPEDRPCDQELVDTFQIDGEGPYVDTFVFEEEMSVDDLIRPRFHKETITLEVAYTD